MRPGPLRAAALGLLAAGATLAGCDEAGPGPLRPAPCQSPPRPSPRELWRTTETEGSPAALAAAGDTLLYVTSQLSVGDSKRTLRRVSPDGVISDLATLNLGFSSYRVTATGDEVFYGVIERAVPLRRIEVRSVPLTGGSPRTLGLVRIDWNDELSGFTGDAEAFAADDRAVYLLNRRIGAAGLSESRIFSMSRSDGTLGLLARARGEVEDPQLVGGEIWWRDGYDHPVHRVPVTGPPTVKVLPVKDCRSLRVTTDQGFFCGGISRLVRHDREGASSQLVIDATNANGDGPTVVPLAAEAGWLWFQENASGNVRKLHLASQTLEDVVCGRKGVHRPPMLVGSRRLAWVEQPDFQAPALLMDQPLD